MLFKLSTIINIHLVFNDKQKLLKLLFLNCKSKLLKFTTVLV